MADPPKKPRSQTRATATLDPATKSRAVSRRPRPANQVELFEDPFPTWLPPMKPTLVPKAPEGDQWCHEIKWDGYRVSCYVRDGAVTIRTKSGLDWTKRFPEIARGLARLPVESAVIDGEAIVRNDEGVSDFGMLQTALSWRRFKSHPIDLMAFDLLYLDGQSLVDWPLERRRDALAGVVAGSGGSIPMSAAIGGAGSAVFESAAAMALEGIISKRLGSRYRPGPTRDWLKTKVIESGTFIVTGYVRSSTGALAALLLGEEKNGVLRPVGTVGSGFTVIAARDLRRSLDSVKASEQGSLVLCKPEMRAAIQFRGRTRNGHLRHTSFKGLRED